MHKHTLVTRFLSIVLIFVMLLSCLPGAVLAAHAAEDADTAEATAAPTADSTETTETDTVTTAAAETTSPTEVMLAADTDIMLLNDDGIMTTGGSSGSVTGTGGGSANVWEGGDAYDGSISFNIYYCTAGVTMQVVYFPYGESYDRNKSYDRIIDTVQDYTYTDEKGVEIATVYDGVTLTEHTFLGDSATGRIFKMENINDDPASKYYKTVELITGRADNCGGTIHPGYHDCVSGPAAVSTTNGLTTYTMPEPTDIELFLKRIIFGSDYGAWDKSDVAKDAGGNDTDALADDVSLYTKMLKYLGCEDEYIQNYLDAYNGNLSTNEHADVMIPTIIWAYVVADCVDSNAGYGFGYTGTNTNVNYKYIDEYAEDCCDGSKYASEGRSHGNVSGKTFNGRPNRKLITSLHTVGDIVCTSYCNNITSAAYGTMTSKEIALDYFNRWWRGTALDGTTGGYASTAACLSAYQAYHNEGGYSNGCGWFGYGSYACQNVFGVHIHKTAGQRHYYGRHAIASGYINYIYADGVDNAAGDNYYFRGYWTPYGERITGTLELKKDIATTAATTSADLTNWRFDIYRTEADALAGTNYLRSEYTDSNGSVLFEGLKYGETFYIKEAPLERQDRRSSLSGWSTSNQLFVGKVPQDSTLVIGTATNTYAPGRPVSILKTPSCSSAVYAQIENNPLYSLAGAEYTIYQDGKAQEVLITDASGSATSSQDYDIGTRLTIQETKAPAGFQLSKAVYEWTVVDGTNAITVEDEPVFDPGGFSFQKTNTSTDTAIGNTSYVGAVFKWEYYANHDWTGMPEKTWYFETNGNGFYRYGTAYLSNNYTSNELYINESGDNELPLGSIRITEVVAPAGYTTMEVLYATVSQSSSGSSAAFDWTDESWEYITTDAAGTFIGEEPIDVGTFGSVSVQKLDADTGSELQGEVQNLKAKFQVINRSTNSVKIGDFAIAAPGEVCYEFWTAEDGSYTSGNIFPIGSYELIEAVPPTGMTLNENWSKTFTITTESRDFDFTSSEDALKNEIIRGGVMISKVDAALGSSTGEGAMLEGISFYVSSLNKNPIVIDGVSYDIGETVATMELEWNEALGKWTASLPGNTLPYGTYQIGENPQKYGSEYANDYYYVTDTVYTFSIRTDGEIVSLDANGNAMEFQNEVRPGKIVIEKVNYYSQHLAGAEFLLEWSEYGSTWALVTFHDGPSPVKGGCTSTALVDGKLTTDETGFITFDGLHPGLMYRVTETRAPDGYVLLADYAFTGELPADDLTVSLKIYNSHGYLLPSTGDISLILMATGGTLLILFALFSFVMLAVRSTRKSPVCYSTTAEQNKKFLKRRTHK